MSSFKAHVKPVDSLLIVSKDGSEHFAVSASKEDTKVWNIAQLMNVDIDAKKPLMVYSSRKEETTCMTSLGNFMSLPILGMGDSNGFVKLAAISQGTKSREMIIGFWKASSAHPIVQLERFEDLNIVATLDSKKVKVWSYSLSDDGLKENLRLSIDNNSFGLSSNKGNPAVVEWLYPHQEIAVAFDDDAAIRIYDINKAAASRSFSLSAKESKMIEETVAEK
jgi:hypothetical protein